MIILLSLHRPKHVYDYHKKMIPKMKQHIYNAVYPDIDSEIIHSRQFIKIQCVNKGIEFINLPSISKDKYVISSIPTYFENTEPPIICYKYNKPFRGTVSK